MTVTTQSPPNVTKSDFDSSLKNLAIPVASDSLSLWYVTCSLIMVPHNTIIMIFLALKKSLFSLTLRNITINRSVIRPNDSAFWYIEYPRAYSKPTTALMIDMTTRFSLTLLVSCLPSLNSFEIAVAIIEIMIPAKIHHETNGKIPITANAASVSAPNRISWRLLATYRFLWCSDLNSSSNLSCFADVGSLFIILLVIEDESYNTEPEDEDGHEQKGHPHFEVEQGYLLLALLDLR